MRVAWSQPGAEDLPAARAVVPVVWTEDSDSRVRLIATAIEDLRGIARLRRHDRNGAGDPVGIAKEQHA